MGERKKMDMNVWLMWINLNLIHGAQGGIDI